MQRDKPVRFGAFKCEEIPPCARVEGMKCRGTSLVLSRSASLREPSAFPNPSFRTGHTPGESAPSVRPEACSSSTSPASLDSKSSSKKHRVQRFSTPVFPRPSNETTLTVKKATCKTIFLTNIRDHELKSPTLDQESILRDPDFYAYWDSSKRDLYATLLSLPETDSHVSGSNSSSGSSINTTLSSSFLTERIALQKRSSERTSWPSYKYTVVDGMDAEGTRPKLKTMKLRIHPNREQKKQLADWAGCSRFTYNKAVAIRLAHGSTQKTAYDIRDRIVTLKKRGNDATPNSFFNNKPWLLNCPKSIRFAAVASAVANVKACYTNLNRGNIKQFDAPFQRKKTQELRGWTIGMEQKNVRKDGNHLYIFKDLLGEMKYSSIKQLHKMMPGIHPDHDIKLQKDAFNEYYLVFSVDWKKKDRKPLSVQISVDGDEKISLSIDVNHFAAVSTDPGVRKTLTTFSPERNESFMIGKGHATDMMEMLISYDKKTSLLTKSDSVKERKNIKGDMLRIRKRIHYIKKEFRDKTAHFLATRYNIVMMPKLGTTDMSKRAGRRLKTKVVRQMCTLGHASIFEAVRNKCREYGTEFMEVKEHYTSQTCPCCGQRKKTSSETYRCDMCGLSCDRDIVGALGIFLKATRKTSPPSGVMGELTPIFSDASGGTSRAETTTIQSTFDSQGNLDGEF